MAKNTGQSPDYNPYANGYSDGAPSTQGRLVNMPVVDSKFDRSDGKGSGFYRPTQQPMVQPTDGGGGMYRPTVMPTAIPNEPDFMMPPDVGIAPPQTEILPPDTPIGGGTGFTDVPSMPPPPVDMGGTQEPPVEAYVSQQPDYSTQTTFEEYTPPDPAANTPDAMETAVTFGGGSPVQNYEGSAEQFLGAGRDLNDISTGDAARAAAEDAIYSSMQSRLDPRFAQEATDLEINLRNRGLSEGDAAFDNAMAEFTRGKTDAYNQAMWQSVMGGGQEAQRTQEMDLNRRAQMFGEALGMSQQEIDKNRNSLQAQAQANQFALGMGGLNLQQAGMDRDYDLRSQQQGYQQQMGSANYQNQLRQQQIQEEMLRRNQSLNELNALLTGSQVSQPNFQGYNQAGYAGGTDYSGAAQNQYQSTLDSFNAGNSMWQGLMGGAAQMYGAGMFG